MNKKTFFKRFVNGSPFTKKEGHFAVLPNGYKFNQYIFYFLIVIILGLGVYVFYNMGFSTDSQIYYRCNSLEECKNPFYKYNAESTLSDRFKKMCTYDWCKEPTLPGGFEFGRKPTYLERNFGVVSVLIILYGFFSNHLFHNIKAGNNTGKNLED